jgi:broad specificity phosphatase PhoE
VSVEIVFETHSTSTDNERGIATGWLPGSLSETGRRQAEELGRRRRDDGVAAVFTSDLHRAVETAEIAFAGSGIPVHRDARLRECDYGELNGLPAERVTAARSRHVDDPFPGGESYRQAVERVRSFLEDVSGDYDGARIVVVGHSATRWALEHLIGGVPLEELVDAPFAWQEGWEYVLPAATRLPPAPS